MLSSGWTGPHSVFGMPFGAMKHFHMSLLTLSFEHYLTGIPALTMSFLFALVNMHHRLSSHTLFIRPDRICPHKDMTEH
jgi:hypothetical protein